MSRSTLLRTLAFSALVSGSYRVISVVESVGEIRETANFGLFLRARDFCGCRLPTRTVDGVNGGKTLEIPAPKSIRRLPVRPRLVSGIRFVKLAVGQETVHVCRTPTASSPSTFGVLFTRRCAEESRTGRLPQWRPNWVTRSAGDTTACRDATSRSSGTPPRRSRSAPIRSRD